MELWIRSTAKTNLLKARFLTIMDGNKFYEKDNWEYNGYTICNCNENGTYELLGTYKTKERAIEVLDEISENMRLSFVYYDEFKGTLPKSCVIYQMPKE